MIKKLIGALALMGCSMSSQAAVQGFDWSYTGFLPATWSERQPQPEYGSFNDRQYFGSFSAEDRDANGVFSLSELTSFTIFGQSFMNCVDTGSRNCSLTAFSYTPGGALTFDAFQSVTYGGPGSGSGWEHYTWSYNPGQRFSSTEESSWTSSGVRGEINFFTPETRFAISEISAVPEPQTWLMLGAGIALLGVVKRRRLHKA